MFGAVAMFLLIGFSRLYVGAHSMNQILYGWSLGLWLAFYFHYCVRKYIITHVHDILLHNNMNSRIVNINK